MSLRKEVVEALCDVGATAMLEVASELRATPAEAISAHFTMVRRAVHVVLEGTKGQQQAENRSIIIDTLTQLVIEAEGTVN